MYLSGAGDTRKSRVINVIRDIFKIRSSENELLIAASSDSAAAKIYDVIIHSTLGIRVNKSEDRLRLTNITSQSM